jgi:hypothetical protein
MVLLALGVIAYALHYISKALSTGSVPGKLGAVYHAPDFHFYALTGLAGLGALFGLALLIMSVRWLRAGRG